HLLLVAEPACRHGAQRELVAERIFGGKGTGRRLSSGAGRVLDLRIGARRATPVIFPRRGYPPLLQMPQSAAPRPAGSMTCGRVASQMRPPVTIWTQRLVW